MPAINVLPKSIAELIAAGEVVERPSSVIKELVENSIDAGASSITVEIKRGGITYMAVKDNGCGISREDVPKAFLRHATSKIKSASDLDCISSLGFRGEALAAISAVSKVEMITKTAEEETGTRIVLEGGEPILTEDIGCDTGTIIIIRDIFYNTPARMKFLKKDVTEGNSVAAVLERIALSHCEIAFKFIRDAKTTLATSGDGKLKNTVYSVLGRDFTASLIPVDTVTQGIRVSGMVCKPVYCKQNRLGQYFFLNARLVKSNTACAALEQAYKNTVMVGKFPCCVLNIELPFSEVDVNVHPAKTEVRFSDEHRVFSAVYAAVKNAIVQGDTRPELKMPKETFNPFKPVNEEKYVQSHIAEFSEKKIKNDECKTESVYQKNIVFKDTPPVFVYEPPKHTYNETVQNENREPLNTVLKGYEVVPPENTVEFPQKPKEIEEIQKTQRIEEKEVFYIGCVFNTYIVAQYGSDIYFIDKHAAHERLIFEELKANHKAEIQQLLSPISVTLSREEYSVISANIELVCESGFEIEDFGDKTVIVRSVPALLKSADIPSLVCEIAQSLKNSGGISVERSDDILHSVACKAAIKGGLYNSDYELKELAKRILENKDIMYCPHGRPVAFKISRRELEKQFGRIQ